MIDKIALFASCIAAGISGGFALWGYQRIGKQNVEIERLKTWLGHGQLIRSTQWNAEFAAYQALWKSLVPLRMIARKLVLRDTESAAIGLEEGDIPDEQRLQNLRDIFQKYGDAVGTCGLAINENAPFYEADIRATANRVQTLGYDLLGYGFAAFVARTKSRPVTEHEERKAETLRELMAGVDELEKMIRKRLSDVQIVD